MKALEAAGIFAIAIMEGKFEFGTEGNILRVKYTGPDLEQEGDTLAALLYLAELDGLGIKDLTTDAVHAATDKAPHDGGEA